MAVFDRLCNAELSKLTKKSQVVLKFVNSLLTNMGSPNIENLSDFKSINGYKLSAKSNEQIIDNHIDDIRKEFACDTKYEQRYSIQNYLIVLLRALLNELNLSFESSHLIKYDVNGNKIGSLIAYSITILLDNQKFKTKIDF